jgi:hypothetical protein
LDFRDLDSDLTKGRPTAVSRIAQGKQRYFAVNFSIAQDLSPIDIRNASFKVYFMNGATITLKNVPPALHRSLKEQAKKHKRSLNQEAIHCLEGALSLAENDRPSLRFSPQPISVGKILQPLGDRADRQEDFLNRE